MTDDQAPPTPLPPAAQSPYPAHPKPQQHSAPVAKEAAPVAVPGIGALGLSLIGGAVAAAIGFAVYEGLFRRRPAPAARRTATRRKAATKRKSSPKA